MATIKTIEEKAKAYDEAIERAKEMIKAMTNIGGVAKVDDIQYLFPELKESEDERIMGNIISTIHLYYGEPLEDEAKEMIAWLEKQGEPKVSYTTIVETGNGGINALVTKELPINGCDDEHKPTDKVEPKFKVGDWVILTAGELSSTLKIVGIDSKKKKYYFDDYSFLPIVDEDLLSLWTIQDAKAGDILSYNDGHGNDCIELIKSVKDKKIEFWFCLSNGNRYEVFDGIVPYTNFASRKDATPATKDKRDNLFAKMREAGYEWDAENLELKKVEQNPAWSEEDEGMLQNILECLKNGWRKLPTDILKYESWLKSLRPQSQWKPSDEQMKALKEAVDEHFDIDGGALWHLYEDLLKLMEK